MSSPPWQDQEEGSSATVLARMYAQRKKEKVMLTLVFLFLALLVFALGALPRGADSSEGVESPEWERRQSWYGFH